MQEIGSEDHEENTANKQTQPPQLLSIELRVLGVLMEKQLTTPDLYPLTLNSVVTACNQKSSREPITSYHQGEVLRTLNELEEKGFVRKEYGSRADKYSQQFIAHLGLGKQHQALLCVMMLRGPQTISELQTRTQRMNQFNDKEELDHCIERLCEREIPFAQRSGTPGQRGERVAHLFSGKPVFSASGPNITTASPSSSQATAEVAAEANTTLARLELDMAAMRDTVRRLETENAVLRHQLENLYRISGHDLPQDLPSTH